MRRSFVLCLLLAAAAAAQPLSRGERDRAMSHLHATRKMVLDQVAGLTPAQWNFSPGPGRWSIAQCLEHILLTEERLFALVTEKILRTPPAPEKATPAQREKDAQILEQMEDRSQTAQAPEELRPAGTAPPAELVERFRRARDRTIAYVAETDAPLRLHFAAGPGGDCDAYQFLLIIAGHTARHVKQIEEIKAAANFPRP